LNQGSLCPGQSAKRVFALWPGHDELRCSADHGLTI
jgi:hypothetical protein